MAKKKRPRPPPKKSNRNLIYAAIAVLALILVVVYIASDSEPQQSDEKLPTSGIFVKLNKPSTYEAGKVKMTEFLKFNCPHCYSIHQELPGLKQKYGDQLEITYVPMLWRTIPADQGYRKSIEAYILAEKAGKGEEMRDALFRAQFVERKDLTSVIVLEDVGRSVELGEDFVTALRNGDAAEEAEANIRLAENFQVDETPTIIINGNLRVTATTDNLDTVIGSLLS